MSADKSAFNEWALVELFGYQKIVGKVSEASLAGGAFLRVDVPAFDGQPAFTRFYGPGAIYSINPVTEEIARGLATSYRNEPVSRYELPQLAEKVSSPEDKWCPECQELEQHCTCGQEGDQS